MAVQHHPVHVHPHPALMQHVLEEEEEVREGEVQVEEEVREEEVREGEVQEEGEDPRIQNALPRVAHALMKRQATNLASIPTNMFLKMIPFLVDLRCTRGYLGG